MFKLVGKKTTLHLVFFATNYSVVGKSGETLFYEFDTCMLHQSKYLITLLLIFAGT